MPNLDRRDIAHAVSRNCDLTVGFAEKAVHAVLDCAIEGIVADGVLNINRFGKWRTLDKGERPGTNPKTKERFIVSARRVVSFKASKIFKNYIDNSPCLKPTNGGLANE